MSVLFSSRDMLEVACNIERQGEAFYRAADKAAHKDTLKAAFDYLAGEERKHLRIFQSMLESLPAQPLPETYTGEYALYIKALSEGRVFGQEATAQELAAKAADEAEVLNVALGLERDSLLFYWEMRGLVRQADQPQIDRVMSEERAHMRQLTDLKNRIVVRLDIPKKPKSPG